jgi:hypothetical protein
MSFRRLYGDGPMHLLGLLACLLVSGAAIVGWFDAFPESIAIKVLAWFGGAIVAHDLVLVPLYSLLDRLAFRAGRAAGPARAYVRIPALLSGLLGFVFFPEILRLGDHAFFLASGLHQRVFLARYLAVCGAMFAISGAAYVVGLRRPAATGARTPQPKPRTARAPGTQACARPVSPTQTHGERRPGETRP